MKRPWILLFAFVLLGSAAEDLPAATLAYSLGGCVPTQSLFAGGCVIVPFELIVLDLSEPLKAAEFSLDLPQGVQMQILCNAGSPDEIVREGDNIYLSFDECLQPAETVLLFAFFPVYDPVVVGESCLGPAIPSQLGLTEAGYLSCDGRAVAFETWGRENSTVPQGCANMTLEQGGPVDESSWGAIKSWF